MNKIKPEKNEEVHLANKRTELAYERTILAYIRTVTSLILFGVALIGFKDRSNLYLYTGIGSIFLGVGFLIISVLRYYKHRKDLFHISYIFKFRKKES